MKPETEPLSIPDRTFEENIKEIEEGIRLREVQERNERRWVWTVQILRAVWWVLVGVMVTYLLMSWH